MDPKQAIRENYERDEPFRMFDTRFIWGKMKAKQLKYVLSTIYGGMVLDVACGPGMYSVEIARKHRVIGMDFAKNMVKAARTYADSEGVSANVRFVLGDAEKLQFADETFDCVLLVDVSHHMTDDVLRNSFSECYRVLKPGGVFITDYKNSWNIALWLAYKKTHNPLFYLQSRSFSEIALLLGKFDVVSVKGHGFPGGAFAPYRTIVCKKGNDEKTIGGKRQVRPEIKKMEVKGP